MKKFSVVLVSFTLLTWSSFVTAQTVARDGFKVIDIGADHRILEQVTQDPTGQPTTNRVVQLASGMNWLNPDTGRYQTAQGEFEIAANGSAVITRARTRMIISPDLNVEGALDIETVEGKRLRCTIRRGLSI